MYLITVRILIGSWYSRAGLHNRSFDSRRNHLTGEHHGFGRFETRQSVHRLLLEVQCVTDLRLLHILHPRDDVAHLACEPARHNRHTQRVTDTTIISADRRTNHELISVWMWIITVVLFET